MTGLARAGDIRGALRCYRTMDSLGYPERVGPEKTRTCFHPMTELGLHEMLDEVYGVYDGLRHLGDAEGAALERSKACVNLNSNKFCNCSGVPSRGGLSNQIALYRNSSPPYVASNVDSSISKVPHLGFLPPKRLSIEKHLNFC
jgi:pentatricopeptide repeat protein